MDEFTKQLQGYRLTTAEITYRRPDFQSLLQVFLWQGLDIAPKFPVLHGFLRWWENNLDGPLYSVQVTSTELIKPVELRVLDWQGSISRLQ